MKTYAETVNIARELAYINNRTVYVYYSQKQGWCTTTVLSFSGDNYTKCFPNGKTEKVVAK